MSFSRAALEAWLERLWYPERGEATVRGGRAAGLLLSPLALLFGAVVRLRRAVFRRGWLRRWRVARPVVVVGNLTVGGTGKTPFTVYLARQLVASGLRPGIVTRGYRSRGGASPRRVTAASDPREVGDEAVLLASAAGCPVVAGRDRVAAARLLQDEVDVILADDGLQHLRLARDLEIVLVDARRGLGNARLLPRGPLREPPSRLREEGLLVVLTGAAGDDDAPGAAVLPATVVPLRAAAHAREAVSLVTGARRPLAAFAANGPVHALAGIANPGRFFALLRAHGLTVHEHPLADHADIEARTLAFGDALPVLMTDKDAVKCRQFADERCWAVHLEVTLPPTDAERLVRAVAGLV